MAPLLAPPSTDSLHADLWAAAQLVAAAALAAAPAPLPPAPVPVQIVAAEPVEPPVTLPLHAPPPDTKFMTTLRRAPDSLAWAVFGGTAAFLAIILFAIWFVVGR